MTLMEAKKILKAHIGPSEGIVEESIIEKPYGWYFFTENKEYLETGDEIYQAAGSGGFLVSKKNGSVFSFPSAMQLEENFQAYESGLLNDPYIMEVQAVADIDCALNCLLEVDVTLPGDKLKRKRHRDPKERKQELESLLQNLPVSFTGLMLYPYWHTIQKIKEKNCMQIALQGKQRGQSPF